jgi:membrane protease YdiL (CAAX protease family)
MPNMISTRPLGIWPTFGLSIVVFVVFLVTQTLVVVAALTLQRLQNPLSAVVAADIETNGFLLSIATLISAPICTALIAWFIRWRKRSIRDYLSLRIPPASRLFRWVMLTASLIAAVEIIHLLVDRPATSTFMTNVYQTAYSLPLLYLAIGVMAPIFEEVFFRGFLFQGIRASRLGAIGAIGLTASLWAFIHVQYAWYDMLYIFGFGLLLGYAQLKTHSLYVPIAMHAFNNLLAVVQVAMQT